MKSLPRTGCVFSRLLLLAGALGAGFCLAQSPSSELRHNTAVGAQVVIQRTPIPRAAILRSVKVISDAEGPAIEIITSPSQALNPPIESLESPPRMVIDLPNTWVHLPRKPLTGDS